MIELETASTEAMLKFKIACKSSEVTDDQIDQLFLDFEISKQEEIEEIVGILLQYRKNVYDKHA